MPFRQNLRICIVDDDPMCREMYKQHLSNMGFCNIKLYDNGQDCINELTEKPDIILLDYNMPPLDGLETLKKIKRFDPDIYLVFISAQEDMRVTINALKYGAFDYVIKGEKEEEMIRTVMEKILKVMEVLSKGNNNKWTKFFSIFSI